MAVTRASEIFWRRYYAILSLIQIIKSENFRLKTSEENPPVLTALLLFQAWQTPSTFVSKIQQKDDFPRFSNIVNTINTHYWEGNFEAGHIKVVGWWFFDWFGFSGVAVCCCFLINYINLWYISQFLFHLILSVTK